MAGKNQDVKLNHRHQVGYIDTYSRALYKFMKDAVDLGADYFDNTANFWGGLVIAAATLSIMPEYALLAPLPIIGTVYQSFGIQSESNGGGHVFNDKCTQSLLLADRLVAEYNLDDMYHRVLFSGYDIINNPRDTVSYLQTLRLFFITDRRNKPFDLTDMKKLEYMCFNFHHAKEFGADDIDATSDIVRAIMRHAEIFDPQPLIFAFAVNDVVTRYDFGAENVIFKGGKKEEHGGN